jgi:hypothetical protein
MRGFGSSALISQEGSQRQKAAIPANHNRCLFCLGLLLRTLRAAGRCVLWRIRRSDALRRELIDVKVSFSSAAHHTD